MAVIDIDPENLAQITAKEGLVVVDFWHERCSWCLKLNPEYEKASAENEILGKPVTWAKFNILKSPQHQQNAMKLGIMSTPTLLFFCQGRPIEMTMGYRTAQQLHDDVARVLKQSEVCMKKSSTLDSFYA